MGGYGFIAAWSRESFMHAPYDAEISFTGLTVSVTMLEYSDGAITRPYGSSAPYVLAASVAVVPEPASALLLSLGLLPLARKFRRERRPGGSGRNTRGCRSI